MSAHHVIGTLARHPEQLGGHPALTAMANAIRVGDHLLTRLGVAEPATTQAI